MSNTEEELVMTREDIQKLKKKLSNIDRDTLISELESMNIDTDGNDDMLRNKLFYATYVKKIPQTAASPKIPPEVKKILDESLDLSTQENENATFKSTENSCSISSSSTYSNDSYLINNESTDHNLEEGSSVSEKHRPNADSRSKNNKLLNEEKTVRKTYKSRLLLKNVNLSKHSLLTREELSSRIKIVNVMKLWNNEFSGDHHDDVLEFLHRLEDCKNYIKLNDSELLYVLPCLLINDAYYWYRKKKTHIRTWKQFKKLFKDEFYLDKTQSE